MPNRYIKESIIASETLAELSGNEERLFWRIIVLADDFGRYYGDPILLRPQCFPRLISEIDQESFDGWMRRLVEAGLIRMYEVGGKRYLQVSTWSDHQQTRAKASKFPDPPTSAGNGLHLIASASKRNQPIAHAPVYENVNEYEYESENDAGASAREDQPTPERPKDSLPQVCWVKTLEMAQGKLISRHAYDRLNAWEQQGFEPEAISEAILEAHAQGKRALDYVEGILRNWHADGDLTFEDAKRRRGNGTRGRDSPPPSTSDQSDQALERALARAEARQREEANAGGRA